MRPIVISCIAICLFACQKGIAPLPGNSIDTIAAFSLPGGPNSCSHVIASGSYKKNIALTSQNQLSVEVNTTKTGSWKLSTDLIDGISFSGAGHFNTMGIQSVILYGSGTASHEGNHTFTLNTGTARCSFVLTVENDAVTPPANIPPLASAGPDMSITLPVNSLTLNGSGTDVDGTIASFAWSQVAGPAYSIPNPAQAQTTMNNLSPGRYEFELKVTDNLGAAGRDTVTVSVYAPAPLGAIATELSLFAVITPPDAVMHYDGNGRIVTISSNYYPDRRITYANNKIATIEFWYDVAGGNQYKGQTRNFVYDVNGNVIQINEIDHLTSHSFQFATFEYNADNSMKTKKIFTPSGGTLVDNAFLYSNGNLVGFVENVNSTGAGDTSIVNYDSRTNNFNNIYPQFYFLDTQTEFDPNYRSEIFYFSHNYPVSFGSHAADVSTNANQKPSEVKFDNSLWWRYTGL